MKKALTFEVEVERVQAEIDTRARDLARKVKLPGFRPGKVPVEVVKRRFKDEILGEAAEAIVNKVVFDELDGRGLKPLAPPKVEEVKVEEGQPMSFKAVFETLPLIELPDWRGLRVTAKGPKVADEDVDKEVDRMREEAARYDPVDEARPTRAGDYVLLDLDLEAGRRGQGRPRRERPHRDRQLRQPPGHEQGPRGAEPRGDAGHRGRLGRGRRSADRRQDHPLHGDPEGHQEQDSARRRRRVREGPRRVRQPRRAARPDRGAAPGLRGAPRRPRDEGCARGGAGGEGRLRGARGAHRAAHDRPHREPRPGPRLPGHRPAQGRRRTGGTTASPPGTTR